MYIHIDREEDYSDYNDVDYISHFCDSFHEISLENITTDSNFTVAWDLDCKCKEFERKLLPNYTDYLYVWSGRLSGWWVYSTFGGVKYGQYGVGHRVRKGHYEVGYRAGQGKYEAG